MARLTTFCVALLCVCSAGHTEDASELAALTFWPRPLSAPAQPVDPRVPLPLATANDEGPDAARRAELSAAVAKRVDAIAAEHARNGERSPALIEELTALAATYDELGEYGAAASALADAIKIARINFGLYSLDQADAVESLLVTQEAKGDRGESGEERRYLRDLVDRHSEDPRTVSILSGLADSEMSAAHKLLGVPAPIEITISFGPQEGPTGWVPPPTPALTAVRKARSDYIAAIHAAVRTRGADVEGLFALEDALVGTVYFEFAHPEICGPKSFRSPGPSSGRCGSGPAGIRILEAKLRDSVTFGRSPIDVAEAIVELGDWCLMVSENGTALDAYELARNLLVKRGVARETIDEVFSPAIPPSIPVLPASIVGTIGDHSLRGYIDAAVQLTRFGDVKDVEILDESAGTSRAVAKGFRHYLAWQAFRPRFVAGELARSDRFSARFYYAY